MRQKDPETKACCNKCTQTRGWRTAALHGTATTVSLQTQWRSPAAGRPQALGWGRARRAAGAAATRRRRRRRGPPPAAAARAEPLREPLVRAPLLLVLRAPWGSAVCQGSGLARLGQGEQAASWRAPLQQVLGREQLRLDGAPQRVRVHREARAVQRRLLRLLLLLPPAGQARSSKDSCKYLQSSLPKKHAAWPSRTLNLQCMYSGAGELWSSRHEWRSQLLEKVIQSQKSRQRSTPWAPGRSCRRRATCRTAAGWARCCCCGAARRPRRCGLRTPMQPG